MQMSSITRHRVTISQDKHLLAGLQRDTVHFHSNLSVVYIGLAKNMVNFIIYSVQCQHEKLTFWFTFITWTFLLFLFAEINRILHLVFSTSCNKVFTCFKCKICHFGPSDKWNSIMYNISMILPFLFNFFFLFLAGFPGFFIRTVITLTSISYFWVREKRQIFCIHESCEKCINKSGGWGMQVG